MRERERTKLIEILFQMRTLTWFSWKGATPHYLHRLSVAPVKYLRATTTTTIPGLGVSGRGRGWEREQEMELEKHLRAFYETDMRNNRMQATWPAQRTEGQQRSARSRSWAWCWSWAWSSSWCWSWRWILRLRFVKIKKFFKKQRRRTTDATDALRWVLTTPRPVCVC